MHGIVALIGLHFIIGQVGLVEGFVHGGQANFMSSRPKPIHSLVPRWHSKRAYQENGGYEDGEEKLCRNYEVDCVVAPGVKWNEILPNYGISGEWILDLSEPYGPYGYPGYRMMAVNRQKLFAVKSFPVADGKTAENYGPTRNYDYDTTMDTVILSQIKAQDAARFGEILESWKEQGFSSHYVVTRHSAVQWVNPKHTKAQLAGPEWNARALAILILTDQKQAVNEEQVYLIKYIIDSVSPSLAYNIDIKYLLSHQEARGSGSAGVVSNVDLVRHKLCLDKVPSEALFQSSASHLAKQKLPNIIPAPAAIFSSEEEKLAFVHASPVLQDCTTDEYGSSSCSGGTSSMAAAARTASAEF